MNENGTETEIHCQELVPVDKVEEKEDSESESEDPAAGTGLVKSESSSVPSTTAEFKKLFQELGISTEGLRGKKAFKDKYDEYQKGKDVDDGEETEDMSDDELGLDTSSFVEVDYEGVEYLEDEETSNIYNVSHQLIGKWNEDGDEIIWADDTFKKVHDTMKD